MRGGVATNKEQLLARPRDGERAGIRSRWPFFSNLLDFLFPFGACLSYNAEMPIGRKKKAIIHIAKQDLRLDEETYRQILKGVAGVESSTQLTEVGFEKVM